MLLSPSLRLFCVALSSSLLLGGCLSDPEKQAKIQAMLDEQQSEEDEAVLLLQAARKQADVASYSAILPLMQRSDLLITWDDVQMNVDSAARGVLRAKTDLFQQALTRTLKELGQDLPADDAPLPMVQAKQLLTYVKLLVDTAAELRISSGASTVPSVNVFIKAQGEKGPTQLTVGYLYPYADVKPASQVVINGTTLPPLVEHLSAEISTGLAISDR